MLKFVTAGVAALMLMSSTVFAETLSADRVDTTDWPKVRVILETTVKDNDADHYALRFTTPDRTVTASNLRELTNQPRSANVVVAVDTSRSLSPEHLQAIKDSLTRYAGEFVQEEQLALLAFNDNVQLVTGFTADKDAFNKTLDNLKQGGQITELYRAMLYGIEILKNIPGRRTLVVLTDGKDEGNVVTREQVLAAARDSNVRISTIGIPGLPKAENDRYQPLLEDFAKDTGGAYRLAVSTDDLKNASYDILIDQRSVATYIYELDFDLDGAPSIRADGPVTAMLTNTGSDENQSVNLTFARASGSSSDSARTDTTGGITSLISPDPSDDQRITRTRGSRESIAETVTLGTPAISDATIDDRSARPSSSSNFSSATDTSSQPSYPVAAAVPGSVTSSSDAIGSSGVSSTTTAVTESVTTAPADTSSTSSNVSWQWIILALLLLGILWAYWRRRSALVTTCSGPAVTVPHNYVLEIPELRRRYPLPKGKIILGSKAGSGIVINHPSISEQQAELCIENECLLRNLDTTRTMYVNGKQVVDDIALKPGDVLQIGKVKAIIRNAQDIPKGD